MNRQPCQKRHMDLTTLPDSAAYGQLAARSPLVRRLLACNPSPFTYTGTGTFVIGYGQVAVIDPGPADFPHVKSLIEGLAGETVTHILVTHTHLDHSPAAAAIQAATGAPIIGCAALTLCDEGPRADAGFDPLYKPDQVMTDGDTVSGPGWTLTAVATPGHTSNHLCFALPEEKALFTGDHVMGWSTTVVAPPDGNMADYIASLKKLLDRDDEIYHPTHGDAITDPRRFVRGLITHRKQRETQILKHLAIGPHSIPAMVAQMYAGINPRLHSAAGLSVLAHLLDLQTRGQVQPSANQWALT